MAERRRATMKISTWSGSGVSWELYLSPLSGEHYLRLLGRPRSLRLPPSAFVHRLSPPPLRAPSYGHFGCPETRGIDPKTTPRLYSIQNVRQHSPCNELGEIGSQTGY